MTDEFASLDALVDSGVSAYKNHDYKTAIENLQTVLDVDPRHWRAKLYLAMSYYHGGEVFAAFRHFTFLQDNCTDADIRDKATTAIRAMNNQITPKGNVDSTVQSPMPIMTCSIKRPNSQSAPIVKESEPDQVKPGQVKYDLDVDGEEVSLEWVDTRTERV